MIPGLASILAWLAVVEPSSPLLEAQVEVLALAPLAPGARAELSLVLREAPDRELPLNLWLEADAAVELSEDRLDWRSVADPLAPLPRLRAPFEAPREPGTYEIRGRIRYFVCGPQWCRTKTRSVAWVVEVAAALCSGGCSTSPGPTSASSSALPITSTGTADRRAWSTTTTTPASSSR